MPRLPYCWSDPQGYLDTNAWCTRYNEFLRIAHNEDGSLKSSTPNVVTAINVQAAPYLAIGDGTTDDRTAIENARAAAAALSNGGTLYFPSGTYKISSNLTFGATVGLSFNAGAMLSIDAGVTVTINGSLEAPLRQIFSGSGTALPTSEFIAALYPQWWGVIADGTNDDYAALNATIVAARNSSQRLVRLPPGTYLLGTLPLDVSGVSIHGSGSVATKIKRSNSASGGGLASYTVILNGSTSGGAARQSYRDFQIDGNRSGNANANYGLALVGNVLNNAFDTIQILNSKTGGLRTVLDAAARPNVNTFINLQIRDGDGKGVELNAGRNLLFYGLDVELVGDIGVHIAGTDEALGRIILEGFWLEKTGDGAFDAIKIGGASDRISLAHGNIQDYGNTAGTAGHGINIDAATRVCIQAVDISPRAGASAAGHRTIVSTASSGSIRVEDVQHSGADLEFSTSTNVVLVNANALAIQIAAGTLRLPLGGGVGDVSVGAVDSGGAGFRLLRVPN